MENFHKDCKDFYLIFEGGQKKVYKCSHKKYGLVVIKEGHFEYQKNLERIKREVEFLKNIDSEYYPKNFEFIIDEKNKKFVICEEYIESKKIYELKNYYNSEIEIIELLKELINGLRVLWDKNIVHRDLKPDNILITNEYKPKIIDLGIARFLDYESLTKTLQYMGPCTPIYASPEQLLNNKNAINMRSDFYSLGIIILEMHLGFHPFHPEKIGNSESIPFNILNGNFVSPETKSGTSERFSQLITRLLRIQPFERFRNYNSLMDFIYKNWG